MQIIDLFSGIAGFSLAGKWMGWHTIQFCEIDKFCQQVIRYHFPNVPIHDDVKTLHYETIRSRINPNEDTILVGGFPCQPFSNAGMQLGTEDDRHLWPYMLRAIIEIKPTWVVGENVRGLVSWNGGLVFDQVQLDLENEGYEVIPFLLPACGVNAPHRRDRIWFVAHANNRYLYNPTGKNEGKSKEGRVQQWNKVQELGKPIEILRAIAHANNTGAGNNSGVNPNRSEENEGWEGQPQFEYRENGSDGIFTNAECERLQKPEQGEQQQPLFNVERNNIQFITNAAIQRLRNESNRIRGPRQFDQTRKIDDWTNFPTQSPICIRDDGFSTESLRQRIRDDCNGIISEKEIDKIISKTITAWRNDTIKGGGNAIVPQVAYQIFKTIDLYEMLY